MCDSPLDSKPRNAGFLSEHIPLNMINVQFGRILGVHFFRIVCIIDVVSYANELSAIVAAREEDDRDTKYLGCRNTFEVWSVGFEDEFVDADGDRANEEGIKLLVVLRPCIV